MNYHNLSTSDIYQKLNTGENGLDSAEVKKRQLKYGKNELTQKKKVSIISLILHQFKDIMIFILFLAAAISYFVGDIKDTVVILIIVLLNALIGFVQEYRAEKAMEALNKMSSLHATIRRAGHIIQVAATEIIPGDIVILEAGMLVPADLRLTTTHTLKIEEASLTGESHPINKSSDTLSTENTSLGDRVNMAYKSTIITNGRGEGVVVATGMNTEIGRIAQLLQEDKVKTPLQKRLADFAKKLSFAVIGICIALFIAGWLRGEEPVQMLLTAISVAVAAIPEALPAVITIALALGAKRMVRKNALIRRLPAAETLGSVSYICTDKTGTITQNKMTVSDCWISPEVNKIENLDPMQIMLLGMELNHDVVTTAQKKLKGDPTEIALVAFTRNNQEYKSSWQNEFKRAYEFPFDSERKKMTTVYPMNGKWIVVTKGAVEKILEISEAENIDKINTITKEFAEQGKRVLAYAVKVMEELPEEKSVDKFESHLQFIGLVAMIDPPRAEAIEAIANCHTAGIRLVMLTGDHPVTAKAIATATGILQDPSDKIITGTALSALSEQEFEANLESIKVFARVSPEQKLKIVKSLQGRGHFVAVTGDGVNDAPALKRADIGIAMGITGTDVSKEAADMILLDDNFATIVHAVREGRRIFDNIRKFIKYILTGNSGEIWTIFLAPLLGLPIPLIPIQILWINLISDGLPALAFASEPAEEDILKRPPRKTDESIFSGGIVIHVLWVGLLMGAVCLGTQAWAIHTENPKWVTMVFTVLSISQMGHALAIRSDIKSLFTMGIFGNRHLIIAVLITIGLQLIVVYLPFFQNIFNTQALTFSELVICLTLSSLVFLFVELEKWTKRRRYNATNLKGDPV
ncbi:calcium-translocating P-type ATPase, PMCA-type [Cyclobacterium marinum]|uniref:calcium-translocating P-type ATPase, PMCA-type n=1 Tax=Cyclobacterium marinum TaxID=104 RepID=UPI0011ED4320|nr:calcium-translocating P-type ATPase, PMCA-type [Cyclobacterium marinum]MBI0399602.1 calcium-translocating P-type ATPase, PMCA-type [Cyclobacterium marinum]